MDKVIVIGCPGSGKSTFSRALQAKTGLPLYYLDMLYWNSDRTAVPNTVFSERLNAVLGKAQWIIDGNYLSTMALRMQHCDTVIFLDYPAEVCLSGIRERRGRPRPDMPWTESAEEEDAEFLAFVRGFRSQSRPEILALLHRYTDKTRLIFTSREEAEAFLSGDGCPRHPLCRSSE